MRIFKLYFYILYFIIDVIRPKYSAVKRNEPSDMALYKSLLLFIIIVIETTKISDKNQRFGYQGYIIMPVLPFSEITFSIELP